MSDIYGEAFRQMGEEPPEYGENLGPGRPPGSPGGNRGRWKNHEPTKQISIRIPAAVYEWLLVEADNQDTKLRDFINGLLRQAYEAGR